jgi:L-fuculose-phosphate aldolase|tara:strand:- start:168 stop:857 length:690 start_codon:yes stop_codon:yes gene_type:complete
MIKLPEVEPFNDTIELRRSLIDSCISLSELGFFIGTWGNIGMRVKGGILVTPSRIDYGEMKEEDLVVVDWDGKKIFGDRIPSSEMQVHRLVMKKRKDFGVCIHGHGLKTSAFACTHKSLPVIIEDMAQIIGGEVQCSKYVQGGAHLELGIAAAEAFGDVSTAVFLANHGVVVGSRNLNEGLIAVKILEKAAGIYLDACVLDNVKLIAPDKVLEERERFIYRYGTEKDNN